jgi:GMP synthase-like glutamine amidotransferase
MKAHVLQHVSFEGIGSIEPWLQACQAHVTYTCFFSNDRLPSLREMDLVIAMGGPMSVNDERQFPWLREEKEFIRNAIQKDIPTIGICLGAQLIAGALGARIYRNAHKEIGWHSVASTSSNDGTFSFPKEFQPFHWHGETFDLPPGATLLAKSMACENQAFQIGSRVVGLQFHLESTPESVSALINNCRDELVATPHIQTDREMLNIPIAAYKRINSIMSDLLSYITRRI